MVHGTLANLPNNLKDYFFDSLRQAQEYIYDIGNEEKLERYNKLKESMSDGIGRYVIVPRGGGINKYYMCIFNSGSNAAGENENQIYLKIKTKMIVHNGELKCARESEQASYDRLKPFLEGIVNEDNITGGRCRTNRRRRTNRKRYSRKH